MKSRIFYRKIQGFVGGLFLTAGFAFLFITIFSLSAAFADPVQQAAQLSSAQSPRGSARSANPRAGGAVRQTNSAQAQQPVAAQSRGISQRTNAAAGRTSGAAQRAVRNRATTASAAGQSRSVVARGAIAQQARVSLTGTATRVSTSSTSGTLATKLALSTYNSIVDPTTGMISADVYSNCIQSYYTCMDEICTARNPGQRRCACAGRVKTFNQVEATLQTAKEDLLKVSGELSLLIATKGESIRSAFELTEAEKSLNCVSFRDTKKKLGSSGSMKEWCDAHLMLDTSTCESSMNATCTGIYGGSSDWMDVLNGADSDILTSLQTYANTINEVNTFNQNDDYNLFTSFNNVDLIVNGANSIFTDTSNSVDKLAATWGYELFQYAHNNVCGRVLDSCFNGIYEMCGNRPASIGGGTGPYNLNSKITVNGDDVEFVTPKVTATTLGTAACYGYTTTSGDPYATLRQPVADSRLSVLQKYVLDANADCDLYGEELKTQAQNMAYQKISATQLLQKKRLEFATAKEADRVAGLSGAKQNFLKCVDEIQQCRQEKNAAENRTQLVWATARIKSFCNQMSNVPACYEQMICNQEATEVITETKDGKTKNTVLLSEIVEPSASPGESCMINTLNIPEIRSWQASVISPSNP